MAPMTFKPQVLGKGLLTLWLVILAGCQTTSNHTDRIATPHGISGQSVSESAQRSTRIARWRAPAEQDEPLTLWTRIRGGFQLDPALIDSPRVDKQRLHYVSQKSTRLNSSHVKISYAVFCLKKKKKSSAYTFIY